jgi:PAS domain S-box-containing protein
MPRKKNEVLQASQTIDKLLQSEARFRAMFDTAAVGIGLMSLDRRIIDANASMCRMLGLTLDEIIGQVPAIATHPEDYPRSTRQFEELLSGEKDYYWEERRFVRKNGDVFWAHVTMSVVRDSEQRPLYLIGMLVDIDDQKVAQEQLLESDALFRAMFDNTSVGIALMTLDRRILEVNEAAVRITSYNAEELKQMKVVDLVHPQDGAIGQVSIRELVDGKRNSTTLERRYIRKNREVFWGRVTYALVRDAAGNPEYLIGLIEDINEQKLSAQRLAEQEARDRQTLEQRVEKRTHELAEANSRLKEEIEQRQRAEEALAAKAAEEAIVHERTRLARELHDAVTQTLFSASLMAEVLPDLWKMDVNEARKTTEELRQLTRGALAEMRTLLLELRPAALLQSRFEDLLKQLTEASTSRARLPINLHIEGERILPPDVQLAFYRISQECLNNIVKYANANQVDITLILSALGAHLEIRDDGIGFDLSLSKATSLGIQIMRERAEAICAEFSITSSPGHGTTVGVTWNARD